LAEVEDSAPPRLWLLIPALVLTVAMLVVYTAGWTSFLVSGLIAAILMVTIGILSEQEARDGINWDVYLAVASAFGIGTALVNSGVAGAVAGFLASLGESLNIGDAGLFGAVYLATFLISNVVTNNAAAALIFPIAITAAEQAGVDIILMSYTVMLGASASFMTPFGYTTNLLIYGPGGKQYQTCSHMKTSRKVHLQTYSAPFIVPFFLECLQDTRPRTFSILEPLCSLSFGSCPLRL
jgi:di/tricarboxylate transporter